MRTNYKKKDSAEKPKRQPKEKAVENKPSEPEENNDDDMGNPEEEDISHLFDNDETPPPQTMADEPQQVVDPLVEREPIVPEYAKVQVENEGGHIPDIPEAPIERPTINFDEKPEPIKTALDDDFGDDKKPKVKVEPKTYDTMGNPNLEGAAAREKNEGYKHTAQSIIDAYEMAHNIGYTLLEKSDEKMMKQAMKGKIDYDAITSEIDLGDKNVIQVKALLHDYNKGLRETLVVEQSFKDEALPILTKICKKRNLGMTDEERLLAIVAKDIQPKIFKLSQLSSTINQVLKHQTEIIRQNKELIKQAQGEGKKTPIIIEEVVDKKPKESKPPKTDNGYGEPEEANIVD